MDTLARNASLLEMLSPLVNRGVLKRKRICFLGSTILPFMSAGSKQAVIKGAPCENRNTAKFRYYDHLKIKTFYPLKTLFWNFKLFFSSFSTTSVHLIGDHLWDCPKVVFKTTFGQSQRWSYYRNFTVNKIK